MRALIPIALAILCLLPASALAWGARGSVEPDTWEDVASGWMFTVPDTDPNVNVRKVYFDEFPGTTAPGTSTTFDANLATLGTAHQPTPYQAFALLGVWKDCNNDGYIGLGDHSLWEYRSELLLSTSICPAHPVPFPIPDGWTPVHNDGQWVHEFLPIGYDPLPGEVPDENPWDVRDQGARVWGDNGLPGARPTFACYLDPVPAGTFHEVGSSIDYVDCFDAQRGRQAEDAIETDPTVGPTFASADETLRAQTNPWGEARDGSYYEAWDCSSSQIVRPVQVTRTLGVGLSSPSLALDARTDGSPAGTIDDAATGLDDCDRADNGYGAGQTTGRSVANLPYATEDDRVRDQTGVKDQTDEAFAFYQQSRTTVLQRTLGLGTPNDLGTGQTSAEGYWVGRALTLSQNTLVRRDDAALSPVQDTTAYAYVSSTAVTAHGLKLPKGTTVGTYGAEACGSFTTGEHNGWQCDSSAWWPGGSEPTDPNLSGRMTRDTPNSIAAFPGMAYDLRDVDCYDESAQAAREQGLSWGLITGTSCI